MPPIGIGLIAGIGALAASTFTTGVLATVLTSLAISAFAGAASGLFRKDPKTGASRAGRSRVEVLNQPDAPTSLTIGEDRVGGSLVWWHAHGGNDNELRTVMICHSEGEAEGNFRLLLGKEEVELQPNGGEFGSTADLVPVVGDSAEDAWALDTTRKQIYEAIYLGQVRGKWRLRGSAGIDTTLHTVGGTPSGGLGSVGDFAEKTTSPVQLWEKTGASTWTSRASGSLYKRLARKPVDRSPYRREWSDGGDDLWFLRAAHHDGSQTTADEYALSLGWPASGVGPGKVYTRVTTRFSTEVFPQGHPPTTDISVVYEGAKRVFDPRIAAGGGAASTHDGYSVTANQLVYTTNAALCAAHVATWPDRGVHLKYSTIDLEELKASADVSDELVENISAGDWLPNTFYSANIKKKALGSDGVWRIYRSESSGTTGTLAPDGEGNSISDGGVLWKFWGLRFEPRYSVAGQFTSDETLDEVLGKLSAAMAGRIYKLGAKWIFWAGRFRAVPVEHEFGPDDIRLPISTVPWGEGIRTRYNAVRGTFFDPKKGFRSNGFTPITSATWESEDNGERIWADRHYPYTRSRFAVHRLAAIEARKNRLAEVIEVELGPRAMIPAPGSLCKLTHNHFQMAALRGEVLTWNHVPPQPGQIPQAPFSISLTVQRDEPSTWSDEDLDIGDDPAVEIRTINALDVLPPTNLQAVQLSTNTAVAETGELVADVELTWDNPDDRFVAQYEAQWQRVGDSVWKSLLVARQRNNRILIKALAPGTYLFRVRSISRFSGELKSDRDGQAVWQAQISHVVLSSDFALGGSPVDANQEGNLIANWYFNQKDLAWNTTDPDHTGTGSLLWRAPTGSTEAGFSDWAVLLTASGPNPPSPNSDSNHIRIDPQTRYRLQVRPGTFYRLAALYVPLIADKEAQLGFLAYDQDGSFVSFTNLGVRSHPLAEVVRTQAIAGYVQIPWGDGTTLSNIRRAAPEFLARWSSVATNQVELRAMIMRPVDSWPVTERQSNAAVTSSWTIVANLDGQWFQAPGTGHEMKVLFSGAYIIQAVPANPSHLEMRVVRVDQPGSTQASPINLTEILATKTIRQVAGGGATGIRESIQLLAMDIPPVDNGQQYAYWVMARTNNVNLSVDFEECGITLIQQ